MALTASFPDPRELVATAGPSLGDPNPHWHPALPLGGSSTLRATVSGFTTLEARTWDSHGACLRPSNGPTSRKATHMRVAEILFSDARHTRDDVIRTCPTMSIRSAQGTLQLTQVPWRAQMCPLCSTLPPSQPRDSVPSLRSFAFQWKPRPSSGAASRRLLRARQ